MWITQDGPGGIWIGELTEEEKNGPRHGLWTIGDDESLKGTPAETDKLLAKSWFSHPKKYKPPGHHVEPPAHQGRREYVMTMQGLLLCQVQGKLEDVTFGNPVDLLPDWSRTWILPDDREPATGLTVCRYMSPTPAKAGGGRGYELKVFQSKSARPCFDGPLSLAAWQWAYVEVFDAAVYFFDSLVLYAQQHAFIPRHSFNGLRQGMKNSQGQGVVIYF